MHKLPSKSVLRKFRFASVILLFVWVGIPSALVLAVYGMVSKNSDLLSIAGVCAGVSVLLILVFFVLAAKLRCPLCIVQPLQNRSCSRHRDAGRILMSYRLKVALSIIFRKNFRCPYCGEPTAMEVRLRNKRP